MGWETYRLGNVCGKGHVIAEDRIETVGAGIDAVTDHVIVTVVTGDEITSNRLHCGCLACLCSFQCFSK